MRKKIARVTKKELKAIINTCFPQRPDSKWALRALSFNSLPELTLHFQQRNEMPVLGFACNEKKSAANSFQAQFPNQAKKIIAQANDISQGNVELHEFQYGKDGLIRWHTDPRLGKKIPIKYARYYRFNTLSAFPDDSEDPILLFKLHTHQHLCRLAQAYFLTSEEKYINVLISQIESWIDQFPIGFGYPYMITLNVAQRLISWCTIFSLIKSCPLFLEKLLPRLLHSIYLQTQLIYQNLSNINITNNFLLAECVALIMVSRFFPELPNAQIWNKKAINLLNQELPKQILSDGMSFEQSLGYQRFVAELLLLICLMDPYTTPTNQIKIERTLEKMLLSLMHIAGLAGDIPQFGDISLERAIWLSSEENILDIKTLLGAGAAFLENPKLAWASRNACELLYWLKGPKALDTFYKIKKQQPDDLSQIFTHGGFAVLNNRLDTNSLKLVVDCGPLGLEGLGGHGHNDILSFVLWKGETPLFIDPGTYTYFSSRAWRDKFRGIGSHNLVQIDNKELASLGPGLFQLGQCTPPAIVLWHITQEGARFHTSHVRSYGLHEKVNYCRKFFLSASESLFLRDELQGKGKHTLTWRFHCHPEARPKITSSGNVRIKLSDNSEINMLYANHNNIRCVLEKGWYSASYGKKETTTVITFFAVVELPFKLDFMFTSSEVTHSTIPHDLRLIQDDLEERCNQIFKEGN